MKTAPQKGKVSHEKEKKKSLVDFFFIRKKLEILLLLEN